MSARVWEPHTDEPRQTGFAMSHQEIADQMGLSRAGVQRIEEEALLKCLAWCVRRGLRPSTFMDIFRPTR